MHVQLNKPEPQPLPEETIDILGLTHSEALTIRVALLALSRTGRDRNAEAKRLHDEITLSY
jgi:hypothetical protein